ncbi:MAG: hypothetical protein QOJ24_2364 [Mycobacterium sp.]|jgi:hypothetical protein|nr:hypothetical protein [Mycobacterium sp.]
MKSINAWSNHRYVPAVAAVLFGVLYLAGLSSLAGSPGVDKSGDAVVSYLRDHASATRVQGLLGALGALALVIVLGYARERLRGPFAYVFTIGSAMVLVEVSIVTWFWSGLALHADHLDPGIARALMDVSAMWGPILTVADVMVALPIVLAAAAGLFPRWLGVLGAVFAIEQLVETITIVGAPGLFISPGGPMNYYLGGTLFIVFFLALGLVLSFWRGGAENITRSAQSDPHVSGDQSLSS